MIVNKYGKIFRYFLRVNKSYYVTLRFGIIDLDLIHTEYEGEKYPYNWNEEYSN
jgi:hypothetical protein